MMHDTSITRRAFSSGLLAAGAAAMTRRATFGAPTNDRIRVGVIGCRNRGWQDAGLCIDAGRFEIVTVCDCDAAMIDNALGTKLKDKLPGKPKMEKDFRKVLDDNSIDAVINATPDHWHALITVQALAAGKHVFLEKPASHNIADGQAMIRAQAKRPDLIVLVGTQQRSGPHFMEAREFIQGGGLGKVAFARAWMVVERQVVPKIPDSTPPASLDYDLWLGPAPAVPYNEQRVHYNWHFFRNTGTGDMGNWGAHWLDVIRWFLNLDLPTSAASFGGQYVINDAKEFPDTHTVIYEFPNLTVLWEQRHWSRFCPNNRQTGVQLDGDKGSMVIDRGGWTFYPRKGEPEKHRGSELELSHIKNFADCIQGKAKPSVGIEEGCKSAIMCHMGNIAALIGRSVRFDAARQVFSGDPEANACLSRPYRAPWKLEV